MKSMSKRAPGSRVTCHLTDFNETLKCLPQNSNRQTGFCFAFFRGEIDCPPVFLGYHRGNRFKIGKIYEVLSAMVFNRLL